MDYNELTNKPSINGVTVVGDKVFEDFGLVSIDKDEVDELFLEVFGYIL